MNREVTVDVVGVKEADNVRWQQYSMTSYWESRGHHALTPLRKTLTFNSSKLDPQVVSTDDPSGNSGWPVPKTTPAPDLRPGANPKMFDRGKDDSPQ